ncbi:MAG TPA: hypothetical protein VK861_00605, partial [Bacteroidales bacterium]|nr:hypothetical protein [Bacteroidales bacterium]
MHSRKILYALAFLLTCIPVHNLSGQAPRAEKGVMDIRNVRTPEKFIIRLNGEWEFYWNKLLHPFDFSEPGRPKPDYYGNVASYWTDYPPETGTEKEGCATYRLTVLLPPGYRNALAFDMPVFDSSYDLYIN